MRLRLPLFAILLTLSLTISVACVTAGGQMAAPAVAEPGDLEQRSLQPTITILVDDFNLPPHQGEAIYPFNRLDGDRDAFNSAALSWGQGQITTTIAPGEILGGAWLGLNHKRNEHTPIDFSAIFPAQIQSPYQSKITGLTVQIVRATPGQTLRLELKDMGVQRWTGEATLDGGQQTVRFALSDLHHIDELLWTLDKREVAAGDFVVLDSITFTATNPITDTATAAFVWSYGQLLANWNKDTGLVRDLGRKASGEFDAIQDTGSLAAATAQAEQLGVVTHADAIQIVETISYALLRLPKKHGLWPHFTVATPEGFAIAPGAEWSTIDTTIAAIGLLTAQSSLGLDTTGTETKLREIDWADLVKPGGFSMGYDCPGTETCPVLNVFGGEAWLVELAYAAATGRVATLACGSPPTDNGAGFIDELAWLSVPPPSQPDIWGTDWTTYRRQAADRQIGYYPANYPGSCFAQHGLFGLSSAEALSVTERSLIEIYWGFGVGGRNPACDGYTAHSTCGYSKNLGAPMVAPHYSALIASLRPQQAIAMWNWLIDNGLFTPLNNAESLVFPDYRNCAPNAVVWNHLKGSHNLSLQTLGWGRYLAEREGQIPVLWRTVWNNTMLGRGYRLLAPEHMLYSPLIRRTS